MLDELCPQIRQEIRLLNKIMGSGEGVFSSPEERDAVVDKLKNHVSDVVLSMLMREDRDQLDYFIKTK